MSPAEATLARPAPRWDGLVTQPGPGNDSGSPRLIFEIARSEQVGVAGDTGDPIYRASVMLHTGDGPPLSVEVYAQVGAQEGSGRLFMSEPQGLVRGSAGKAAGHERPGTPSSSARTRHDDL